MPQLQLNSSCYKQLLNPPWRISPHTNSATMKPDTTRAPHKPLTQLHQRVRGPVGPQKAPYGKPKPR